MMIRALLVAFGLLCAAIAPASAQGCGPTNPNCVVPTAPNGDNTNKAASTAFVQNAFAGGSSLALASGKILIGQVSGFAAAQTPSGDLLLSNAGAFTFNTVNSNVGSFGSATSCVAVTVNGKGLITAIAAATCTPAIGSVTGLGTNVATALGVGVGSAGAFVTFNGALGTPSSATLTNATGLPISTGVSGLGAGVATALANAANANSGFPTYVAGGWTPTITTSATVGTPAYTVQLGTYEIIGRQVTARFTIVLSGWTGSPTGSVLVGGLPVAAGGVANDNGQCRITFYTVVGLAASNIGMSGVISAATPSTITLQQASNTATTQPTAAQIGTTPTLSGICNYHT
jgi:hypothetical protein